VVVVVGGRVVVVVVGGRVVVVVVGSTVVAVTKVRLGPLVSGSRRSTVSSETDRFPTQLKAPVT
jgi:hypothetical protein